MDIDNPSIVDIKKYINISNGILGNCETKLRNHYNMTNDTLILIITYEIYIEGFLIPIVEYETYNTETKENLDLDICKDDKIDLYFSVSIDENNLFKYNSSHEYYNDMCYAYTTDNGTDIIINDRRNEFINNNLSLCEKNCEYKGYDNNTKKVLCECFIKTKFHNISEIEINKETLLNNFKNYKKSINLKVVKCYKSVFTKEGLIKNIGQYILSLIILVTIILTILFIVKGFNKLIVQIQKLLVDISYKNKKNIKNNPKKRQKKKKKMKLTKIKSNDDMNKKIDFNSKKTNISFYYSNIMINNLKTKLNKTKKITYYNDYELNNLNYIKALNLDKRTYFQYYFSLLKIKHLIIFTFYTYSDYNSKLIKYILFLFSFSLYITINALFFSDSTMHKIYEDYGKYNFIFQIPNILYSGIISGLINTIIKYLSLSEKNIIEIKIEKKNRKKKQIK